MMFMMLAGRSCAADNTPADAHDAGSSWSWLGSAEKSTPADAHMVRAGLCGLGDVMLQVGRHCER